MGLLLEVKKPLERTPHFFGPGDGECVNASGQLVPIVGLEPTYSRFLNALQDIFGIVEWNLRLNSLRHLPFVLKWADGCLSLQTVTEIFTRRFSQRRSLIQHSGGFLFPCEVAPLFRGSRLSSFA